MLASALLRMFHLLLVAKLSTQPGTGKCLIRNYSLQRFFIETESRSSLFEQRNTTSTDQYQFF